LVQVRVKLLPSLSAHLNSLRIEAIKLMRYVIFLLYLKMTIGCVVSGILIFTFRTAIKNAMPAVLVVALATVPSQRAFPAVIVVVVPIRAHTRVRVLGHPTVGVGLVAALIRVTAVTPSAIAVEIVTLIRTITINVEVLTYSYIF
jgi:hypothetical protein